MHGIHYLNNKPILLKVIVDWSLRCNRTLSVILIWIKVEYLLRKNRYQTHGLQPFPCIFCEEEKLRHKLKVSQSSVSLHFHKVKKMCVRQSSTGTTVGIPGFEPIFSLILQFRLQSLEVWGKTSFKTACKPIDIPGICLLI